MCAVSAEATTVANVATVFSTVAKTVTFDTYSVRRVQSHKFHIQSEANCAIFGAKDKRFV